MEALYWAAMEMEASEREVLAQLRRLSNAWFDQHAASIGPYTRVLRRWCSDATLARYGRARKWDAKRADKMLRATLEWRVKWRPEEITYDQIAHEAESGKMYISTARDKENRPLMILVPGRENTVEVTSQIRYLVYTMEATIHTMEASEVPRGSNGDTCAEQLLWCVDFTGYTIAKAPPFSTSLTVLQTLQNHYPERLGRAIPYNPPRIFGIFWSMISAFFDPVTAQKVKFVFPAKKGQPSTMGEMFDLEKLESAIGGDVPSSWDPAAYARRMRSLDARRLKMLRDVYAAPR